MKSESTWRLVARPLPFVDLTNFRFVGRSVPSTSPLLSLPPILPSWSITTKLNNDHFSNHGSNSNKKFNILRPLSINILHHVTHRRINTIPITRMALILRHKNSIFSFFVLFLHFYNHNPSQLIAELWIFDTKAFFQAQRVGSWCAKLCEIIHSIQFVLFLIFASRKWRTWDSVDSNRASKRRGRS